MQACKSVDDVEMSGAEEEEGEEGEEEEGEDSSFCSELLLITRTPQTRAVYSTALSPDRGILSGIALHDAAR